MYKLVNGIPVWGEHDDATLGQIERCAGDDEVAGAALMADGHKGYSMPIGGVVAYRDAISPSGVGYDISCLALGTRVTTEDGYYLPIEQVQETSPIVCWDGGRVRPVSPNLGAISRGIKPTLNVTLANGRVITATPDHRVLTREGWKEVGQLSILDAIACTPFVGLAYEAQTGILPLKLRNASLQDELAQHDLFPLRTDSALFSIIVRLLGFISGNGHVAKNGTYISIYTTSESDTVDIVGDFARLGYRARVYQRVRPPHRQNEMQIRVNSVALHALFEALGSPVGKKYGWITRCPGCLRCHLGCGHIFCQPFAALR